MFNRSIRSFLYFILLSPIAFAAQAEMYTIDPAHSQVEWHISHFGFSKPTGKWMVEGTLNLDKQNPQQSHIKVNVDVSKMITGNPELNKHLQGPLFFNVKEHLTATFESGKITVKEGDTAEVRGMLTLMGVAKPLVIDVKLNKMGTNPITDKPTVGFSGQTELKRSDFGLTALLPGLGDDVTLSIQVEAYLSDESAA